MRSVASVIARLLLPAVCGAISVSLLSGCVVREQTTVYGESNPVIVDENPPVVYEPGPVVVVHRAPPPVIVERVPPTPGPGHVWVNGYWRADHDNWVWVKGRWAEPPRHDAVWVPPRYERHDNDVHFSMGFWK